MKKNLVYIWIPSLIYLGYILGMIFYKNPSENFRIFMFSELGVIENLTAVFFAIAGVYGARLFLKSKNKVAMPIRIIYAFFCLGSFFVALEEINYGQFYYNWQSGEWWSLAHEVREDGSEFNLHKLAGHKPARRMNTMATFGFPMVCIVLPLIAQKKKLYQPGKWAWHLLPRNELILMTIMAQLATWFNRIYPVLGGQDGNPWARASEFKEMYWGMILFGYGFILLQRLKQNSAGKID